MGQVIRNSADSPTSSNHSPLTTHHSPTTNHRSPTTLLSLTRPGRYWLLLSAALLLIGMYKGVNLLCLLAYVMFVCLFLNLMLAGRRLRHVRAVRRIGEPAF